MPDPARVSGTVISADGTTIAFDRSGSGPAIILVHGAFTDRTHPTLAHVAAALAPWFTVINYDRRGRGESGDVQPYSVEREIEDLAALIEEVGGTAMVFGGSSGAALALEAAARLSATNTAGSPSISKLAIWEPPYHVDAGAPHLPDDFGAQLSNLIVQGRRADAVERFMCRAAEVPAEVVAAMRAQPFWPDAEAVAHTLAYEAAVMGPGNALPADRLASISMPTLVLNGENSPAWMGNAGKAVAAAVPNATHRVLDGQTHDVSPETLAPELLEFFIAA